MHSSVAPIVILDGVSVIQFLTSPVEGLDGLILQFFFKKEHTQFLGWSDKL